MYHQLYLISPKIQSNFLKADKKLGQHFLVDESARQQIASLILSGALSNNVLEIGPGMGAITQLLLPTLADKLTCIELDARCVSYLHAKMPSLKIRHEDFLSSDYIDSISEELLVCGNFPYNISTEIVFKVLEHFVKIPMVVGMFQKEVAYRLAAKSGSKVYGITSVLAQFFYDIEINIVLPPQAFSPPPQVESAVITMVRKSVIPHDISYKNLSILVKTAFNQRRKMLRNALKNLHLDEGLIQRYGAMRAEQLTLDDYCTIAKTMS